MPLQLQIWLWLKAWEERFLHRIEGKCWKEGGLDRDDLAGHSFVHLLKRLRIVLLQDLAVLQPRKSSLLPSKSFYFSLSFPSLPFPSLPFSSLFYMFANV